MLEEIKSLPPLPISVVRIQELCMSHDTDIDELSRVIEHDPMLSANILKSVNSPLYGMSKEISSISKAVMLFGISMIRGFAAASAIKKSVVIDLSPYSASIDDLTTVSTLQMSLAREWYRNVDKSMLPLLQSSAFLMELGKLVASLKVISTGNLEHFLQDIAQGGSLEEVERKYLEISSYEIAAAMFEHWNFETALIETLREISNPSTQNPHAQVLRVITQAVNLRDTFSEEGIRTALEMIEGFGLNKSAFEEAIQSVKSTQKQV
ncbi:MAG: HDOD domain-containing protein [Sulfuricurvum sp.]|uniref:HDOD domain-containing protein n=1 Tax=Sulfuricurvum sp. TaxID=2025608 RepID=UPI002734F121|nr:HDOD domain-containing protein [Sulfuricurvum sp.]MDP2850077.1 HDOD domain-containing protein [Sulfuricurvum sp.]